jgi:hypothetical protein
MMQAGDRVTIDHQSTTRSGFACIRPEYENWGDCYWVQRDKLMAPEEWREWKAKTDATVASFNDGYAQNHPECKDWRTNKNLPKRCY